MLCGMEEAEIRRELTRAQDQVVKAPLRRRKAVMLAREHGWSKYKIAATLGVKGPTVDSIIAAAMREQEKE